MSCSSQVGCSSGLSPPGRAPGWPSKACGLAQLPSVSPSKAAGHVSCSSSLESDCVNCRMLLAAWGLAESLQEMKGKLQVSLTRAALGQEATDTWPHWISNTVPFKGTCCVLIFYKCTVLPATVLVAQYMLNEIWLSEWMTTGRRCNSVCCW